MTVQILIKPLITEKAMLAAAEGIYTFQVDLSATKHQIKEVVESTFTVKVTKVTTTTTKPSMRKTGRRRLPTTTSKVKKARVWLKKGQTIDLFEFKEE